MGSVYKRGNRWWIQYYDGHGKRTNLSVGTKYEDAKRELKFREGRISEGTQPVARIEKVTFDNLSELYLNDYITNHYRTIKDAERKAEQLRKHFGGVPAIYINSDRIDKYVHSRISDGLTNAAINRELAALKRMFMLGKNRTPPKVLSIPHIPMLAEDPARSGFLEHVDYRKLLAELPEYLRLALTIAYHTGLRSGEVLSLTWSMVNLTEGSINLQPINTKTKESRTVYLTGEFYQAIADQKEKRDRFHPECPYVVFNRGKRIKDFGTAWDSACKRAGLAGLLFHDLRRSGCRNMIRAGVDEKTAMLISGHKTSDVFKRYNIINDTNLKDASEKVMLYFRHLEEKAKASKL
jgi:integrase